MAALDTLRLLMFLMIVIMMMTKGAVADADLYLKLVRLTNPRGNGANGHCCDGRAIFCFSRCDHQLAICLDNVWGSDDYRKCAYGRRDTGAITDMDDVYFGSNAAGLSNPMYFHIKFWTDQVKLKVHIVDIDDHNSNDFVDLLIKNIKLSPSTITTLYLQNRVTLQVEVMVSCSTNYYGPSCSTYCTPQNTPIGHYTCHPQSGARICLQGWRGGHCAEIDRDDCLSQPCQHGGTCRQGVSGFLCSCPEHTHGLLCDVNALDDCLGSACPNNGTCQDFLEGNHCLCRQGWTGGQCNIRVSACDLFYCLHEGTCNEDSGNPTCICSPGHSGTRCESEYDPCWEGLCVNGATCQSDGQGFLCHCEKGFVGTFCEKRTSPNEKTANPSSSSHHEEQSVPEHFTAATAANGGFTTEGLVSSTPTSVVQLASSTAEEIVRTNPPLSSNHTELSFTDTDASTNALNDELTTEGLVSLTTAMSSVVHSSTEAEDSVHRRWQQRRLSLPLYVRGSLTDEDGKLMDKGLERMLRQYGGYTQDLIHVATQRKAVVLLDGTQATEVSFQVVINRRSFLTVQQLVHVISSVPPDAFDDCIPFSLLTEKPIQSNLHQRMVKQADLTVSSTHPQWYVFMAVALCCGSLLIVVFIVLRRRKSIQRKLSQVPFFLPLAGGGQRLRMYDTNVYFEPEPIPDTDPQPTFDLTAPITGRPEEPFCGNLNLQRVTEW